MLKIQIFGVKSYHGTKSMVLMLNAPPYMFLSRSDRRERSSRTYGGVRGALVPAYRDQPPTRLGGSYSFITFVVCVLPLENSILR